MIYAALLQKGVAKIRQACVLRESLGLPNSDIKLTMVSALTNIGEQCANIDLLREACSVANQLLADINISDDDRCILKNSQAVAQIRIGQYTNDSATVRDGIEVLRVLLKSKLSTELEQY